MIDESNDNQDKVVNIFQALSHSLESNGLDIAFMSDTASVMKGVRSGVQKLIKNRILIYMMLAVYAIWQILLLKLD